MIDLHTHSNVSDGTDTPAELVANAARRGLTVVALTDHDTHFGIPSAVAAGELHGVRVISGMELSTQHHGQSVHLLVYGADPTHAELNAELARVLAGRSGRVEPVLAKLSSLGVSLTSEQVQAQAGDSPSLGRPHIADAMVAAGYVADRREAFDRYLADDGPAHVARYAPDLTEAIALARRAGGATVIAHPWGRGTRSLLSEDFLAELAADHGLNGIEADHLDHDSTARAGLRRLAEQTGLIVTGSSDYHGTGKAGHDLGSFTTEPRMFERLMERVGSH